MGKKILIVDDDNDFSNVSKKACEVLGYEAVIKESSKEALEDFTKNHQDYAAVIVDYMMPAMKGDEIVREMQKIHPGMPCMLVSVYPADLDLPKTVPLYSKPLSVDDISKALTRLAA